MIRKTKVVARKRIKVLELTPSQVKVREAFIRAYDLTVASGDCPTGITYLSNDGKSFGIRWGTSDTEMIDALEQDLHDALCRGSNGRILCLSNTKVQ